MNADDQFISRPDGGSFALNLSGLMPDQRVGGGRFRLTRLLGQGGMGVVWQAEDQRLGGWVALKFLPPAIRGDAGAVDLLRAETRRSLKLSHPNIVRIHDLHDLPGEEMFFAMEFVDGPTLAAVRVGEPERVLRWEYLAPLVRQLCAGLEYAHAEGVIHRDLKPSNLMVGDHDRLKLADFGVACGISETLGRLTGSTVAGGTLVYMSPQQLGGGPPQVTDDLYSLGATLYELLTGEPPFCRGDIAHQVRSTSPESIAERLRRLAISSRVPATVEAAILACLAKDPGSRSQSAGEVADRLGLGAPTPFTPQPARTAATGSTDSPSGPRGRLRLAAILGIVLVAAAAAGIGWWFNRRTTERPVTSTSTSGQPRAGLAWENSLRMRFVPVGDVLFSIWETRVRDFDAFVRAAVDRTERPMDSIGRDGEGPHGFSWRNPGHPQGPDHPVVGMRWADVLAFCDWLTTEERRQGRLGPDQRYRPPTDAEWSAAVGEEATQFPWGTEESPPPGAGNYAGAEVETDPDRPPFPTRLHLGSHRDEFSRTAPVGSCAPNRLGIYDLGGNVLEWCARQPLGMGETNYLRGGSWDSGRLEELQSSWRLNMPNGFRSERFGFRCVLALHRAESPAAPGADVVLTPPPVPAFTNSLGQPFVPVGQVLMAAYETRVRDFAAFVDVTGYDATREDRSFGANPWLAAGQNWRSPGFPQDPNHPVVLVHVADATAFCAWLSTEDRGHGRIGPGQRYRLPTDEEWSQAVLLPPWRFPWGDHDAPSPSPGNYLGASSDGDRFAQTAPVASFDPNPLGLHDLGGNAWEWCQGRRGNPTAIVARGGSWESGHADHVQSSCRLIGNYRSPAIGFRCVLDRR